MIVSYPTSAYDPDTYWPPAISIRKAETRNYHRNYSGLVQAEPGNEGLLQIEVPDTGTHIVRVHQTEKRKRPGEKHFHRTALYLTVHNGEIMKLQEDGTCWSPYWDRGISIIQHSSRIKRQDHIRELESELDYHRLQAKDLIKQIRHLRRQQQE
jgi:hypothetical protein